MLAVITVFIVPYLGYFIDVYNANSNIEELNCCLYDLVVSDHTGIESAGKQR